MTKSASLQGRLILDTGSLAGSFFERTVILMCRHDESGAFGLVLNRPVKHALGEVFKGNLASELSSLPLFLGGPVEMSFFSFLRKSGEGEEGDVLPWLTLGHHAEDLEGALEDAETPPEIRVFAGYAGWAPGQLEGEMQRQCWHIHPPSAELVFAPHPENLWSHIMRAKGGLFRLVAAFPPKTELN